MKHKLFLFLFPLILLSCQQQDKYEKAKELGYELHAYTSGHYKTSQQEFINKLTESISNFLQDNDTVNTKGLHKLLDEATRVNRESYDLIEKTVEMDKDINIRQKALEENLLYGSLYENEFPKIIELIENKDLKGLRALSTTINQRQEELEKARSASEKASHEFSKKYKLPYVKDTDG